MNRFYLALPLVLLLAVPAYSQTFCNRIGNAIVCDGDNGSSRTIAPLGRNGGIITDERGNVIPYTTSPNGAVILDSHSSKPDWERRSEERRREIIYGHDRRDDSRSRYRDEER